MLLLSLGVIWGVPYLLIKVAVDEHSPSTLVPARTTMAGLLLSRSLISLLIAARAVQTTARPLVVFFELIAEVGPTRSTVITYLNPAVALLLGVAILDESFTVATAVGFALILTGSFLATRATRGAQTDGVGSGPLAAASTAASVSVATSSAPPDTNSTSSDRIANR